MKKLNLSFKKQQCQCGKTKDLTGNCDGSHANKYKRLKLFALTISVLFSTIAFGSIAKPHNDKKINTEKSTIIWKGNKVTGGHEGIIEVKSGFFRFHKKKLIGGEVEIDMNSIVCTDLIGKYKDKLEGHLKSDDFFGVSKHPISTLKIIKVTSISNNAYLCTGKITIKGKTEIIEFNISISENNAITKLKIDRTKFNIKYGSGSFFEGLGNRMIYDEFDLDINLKF